MYKAPVEEILFTLKHVAGLGEDLAAGVFGDLDEDLVDAILGEAGRFATEEVAPLADIGDKQGSKLDRWQGQVAGRLARSLPQLGGRRLEQPDGAGGIRRPGACRICCMSPPWNSGTPARWPLRWRRC